MPRTRTLSPFTEELIRWRWAQRPTLQSLADEYRVSVASIKDAINPKLRKRGKRKPKNREYEGPEGSGLAHTYPARKVSRRKG